MSAAQGVVVVLAVTVLAVEFAMALWRTRSPGPHWNAGHEVAGPELDVDEPELPYRPPHNHTP